MKRIYLFAAMAGLLFMNSCKDDDAVPGNPVMDVKTEITSAYFGDSLAFTINASDVQVPLSTLKAQLYFGEEKVSETVIRTKVSGEDYTGKIFVPFYKDIPNGKATLKYILQNIHFTITEQTVEVSCTRPQFDHLVLVTEDGKEYNMPRTGENQYAVTAEFPQKLNAYIKAPAYGANGNEITFGYSTDGSITEGTTSNIPFSGLQAGTYEVTFNTLTYVGSPFISMKMNGEEFAQVDANTLKLETTLEHGEAIVFEGVPGYENYYIDPDFFTKAEDGSLTFAPISGNYRHDGTGVVYIIGESIGKPTVANAPGWTPEAALTMAPVEAKKYQVTVVGGKQIATDAVNFKFYGTKGWDDEYKSDRMSSDSDLFRVNEGDGNIHLHDGVTLEEGATYVITVDMTDPSHAVMHAVKK